MVSRRLKSAPALLDDLFNLLQVIQIMSSEHTDNMGDAFLAALLMHSVVLPKSFRNRLQKCQVVLAQYSERFQRGLGIALQVVKSICPRILIECLQRDAILAENHSHTPSACQFGVR